VIEQLQRPLTALPMIIYSRAGEAKAEVRTALAPAAIIVLMVITFLCDGVTVFLRVTTSGGERAASSAR